MTKGPFPAPADKLVGETMEAYNERTAKKARYRVIKGSQSCHCCFDFTVVDTSKPSDYTPRGETEPHYEPLCECFDQDSADAVAEALNIRADLIAGRDRVGIIGGGS